MAAVGSASDFGDTVFDPPPPAPVPATRRTRIVYCLALAGLVFGVLGQATSWVGLFFGGGVIAYLGPMGFFVITALVLYRIYRVTRYPPVLDARPPNLAGRVLRGFGWVVMAAGAVAASATIIRWPAFLLGGGGPGGIGFFVVGIFATIVASLGWIGCLLFDASRHLGTRVPATQARTPRQRMQDWSVLGGLVLMAIAAPWTLKQFEVRDCWGFSECSATIEGGIERQVAWPVGAPVHLESNIDEVEYRQTHGKDWTAVERPAYSLWGAGHPVAGPRDPAPVKVSINASTTGKGVALTLAVSESGRQTARFTTTFARGARLVSTGGTRKLVVDLRRGVIPPVFGGGDRHKGVFDHVYRQMRSAIVSPRELAEIANRREVAAVAMGEPRPVPGWSRPPTRLTPSCDGVLAIVPGQAERDLQIGNLLSEVKLLGRQEPPLTLLLQRNDNGKCDGGAIWLVDQYPARSFRFRKYDLSGALQRSLQVTFPPEHELGVFDQRELVERDGSIEVAFVKERPATPTMQRFRVTP